MENTKTRVELIQIANNITIYFLYVPKDYNITSLNFEMHDTQVIGRLNNFNRYALLKKWRQDNGDLVKLFTNKLKEKGWDFNEFPNPVAYIAIYKPETKGESR